ncbi:hypothetical protein RDWZM_002775 [Blomia tropicalis]|uniref:Biogenesis of lysosome-related organelles complex 1 subunit 1 n=1 Tax=Blomia tropicalis TaxID=40697 RepID=A0A9Q0RS22_BLOTA|nr:hypothetical protein RDWZM_002775 [Blomia tropicalis]
MYIWPGALTSDRNHPKTIKRNFVSVLGASFIASKVMTIFLNWHDTSTKTVFQYINLHTYQSDWDLFLYCVLYPLLHVMILFIGPIINDCGLFIQTYLVAFKSNPVTFSIQLILLQLKQLTQIVLIRNLVVAPLTEEFIFRGIMLSVLTPFWSKGTSALVSSFLFGLMHAHHFFRTLLLYGKLNRDDAFKTIFQCIYTTLFGLYASMAYLRSEQKRNAAIGSSVNFATAAVTHLNDGVAQTYLNQRKLDSEAKQLVANIDQFSRSINQWVTLMNNFNDSLKQLGDVENWAKCIENDMNEVSSILEYVYKSYNQTGTENET